MPPLKTVAKTLVTTVAAATLAALTTACASTGAVPKPFPTPGGSTRLGGSTSSTGSTGSTHSTAAETASGAFDSYALVGTALSLRGAPYRNGGVDPKGFDCSGFTQYVFAHHGVALPRGVREQFQMGRAVKPDKVEAGDLLFFATTKGGPSHVGIAVGGDQFVHAPSSTGVVRTEHASRAYWSQRFLGARRVAS